MTKKIPSTYTYYNEKIAYIQITIDFISKTTKFILYTLKIKRNSIFIDNLHIIISIL